MNEFPPESSEFPQRPVDSTGGRDTRLAERLINAIRAVAAEEQAGLVSQSQAFELMHEAARLYGCLERREDENLARRRTRWKVLLRRALYAAVAGYVRSSQLREAADTATPADLCDLDLDPGADRCLMPDARSASLVADRIARSDSGLGLTLVLGGAESVAVALAARSSHRVFSASWIEPNHPGGSVETQPPTDLTRVDSLDPSEPFPQWLRQRFQTVYIRPPTAGFTSQKAILSALAALDSERGHRLFLGAHPARQLGYFSLLSTLGRHGYFLERLDPDLADIPLDPEFAHQLLTDLLDTPEAEGLLDPETLTALLSSRTEPEHLHCFCGVEPILLRGERLSLEPLKAADIPLYDAWLTPQFSEEVGFDADRPRPTVEELRIENWYPAHEWWLARDDTGTPIGMVHLLLHDFWTQRHAALDIGFAVRTERGRGGMRDLLRLTYHRVFEQLGAESLWANVSVSNQAVRQGARSSFFRSIRTFVEPGQSEEWEEICITAEEYRARRDTGQLTRLEQNS